MSLSATRVRAIARKDVREYRRNRSIVSAMAILPLVFIIQPLLAVFAVSANATAEIAHRHELLYMLAIPALVPAALAAFTVAGERAQGTLEPLLGTPVRREELLLGKALAVLVPAVAVSYVVYGVYLACVALFAGPGIASALIRVSDVIAQVLFTPAIAGWSIWAAMVISARASDIRVAQQLSFVASLPSVAVTTLIALDVIHASLRLAVALGIVLLLANRVGWRLVSAAFDRERLVTGTRA